MVRKIESRQPNEWIAIADWQNGYRRVQVRLPALLTVTRELNRPRALSFSGILKARKKTIEQWDRNALGIPEEMVGAKGSPTIVSQMATVEKRRNVEFLQGNLEEKADKLVSRLDEAGII
jgi:electron transfer flavoprotein beta subunit